MVDERIQALINAELDGELVMLSIERGQYYGLADVAKRIWELIAMPIDVSVLCDQLLMEFDVERAICEREVMEFLTQLLSEGMIRVRDDSAG